MEDNEIAIRGMDTIKLEDRDGVNGAPIAMEGVTSLHAPGELNEVIASPGLSADNIKSPTHSIETPVSARLSRSTRKPPGKLTKREPPVFDDFPDVTAESCSHFQVIPDCLYGSKHLGSTDNDSFDCDCRDEWRT